MLRLQNHLIGVDRGDVILFSDFENDGEMWTGQGPRQAVQRVRFAGRFRAPPSVMVAMSMWDIAEGANARADVSAEDVTETGFSIVFRTWGDTRVARIRVGWQAIGELPHDDDWEID